MNIFEETRPLKIIHPIGGERAIAALFSAPEGLYFFDVGWYDPYGMEGNWIHFVQGIIEEKKEGKWAIGDSTIEVMANDDLLIKEHRDWQKYIDSVGITKQNTHDALLRALDDEERGKLQAWEEKNGIKY